MSLTDLRVACYSWLEFFEIHVTLKILYCITDSVIQSSGLVAKISKWRSVRLILKVTWDAWLAPIVEASSNEESLGKID